MPTLLKAFKDFRYRVFYDLLLTRSVPLASKGDPCPWIFSPAGLNAQSIIYSGGVGGDVSFERQLVKDYGCRIVLCDPSPTGARTMAQSENQIPEFCFFPVALSGHSGHLNLSQPLNQEGDWWLAKDDISASLQVPCTDLQSLMQKNNHSRIDLLKLDIEGSEYEVLDDILRRRIPIGQICVEYHHGILPGLHRSQTLRSIFKLRKHGYKLIAHDSANHTFLRISS